MVYGLRVIGTAVPRGKTVRIGALHTARSSAG